LVVAAVIVAVVVAAVAGATWMARYQPVSVDAFETAGLHQPAFSNVDAASYVDGQTVGVGYMITNTGRVPIRLDGMHIDFPRASLLQVDGMWLGDPRGGNVSVDQPGSPAFPRTLGHGEHMVLFVRYRMGGCEAYAPGDSTTYYGPMRFTTHVLGVTRHIALPMQPIGVAIPSSYVCPRPRVTH
jgi:hypothetical protein